MKKLLLSVVAVLMFSTADFAQNIKDFTLPDTKGTTHHLYTYLSAGYAVVLEFFNFTC